MFSIVVVFHPFAVDVCDDDVMRRITLSLRTSLLIVDGRQSSVNQSGQPSDSYDF